LTLNAGVAASWAPLQPPPHRADRFLAGTPRPSGPDEPCLDEGMLLAYRAEKLEPSQAEAVETHLSRCPTCQSLLISLAEEIPRAPARRTWTRPAAVLLALAAAFALLGVFVLRDDPSGPRVQLAYRVEFAGESKTMAPSPRAEEKLVLNEGSVLSIEVTPEESAAPASPPEVGLFYLDRGKLSRLKNVEVERIADGLRISVPARVWGEDPATTLILGATPDKNAIERWDGREWDELEGSKDARFWSREVRIIPLAQP
jgi:hypothetical protein